MHWSNHQPCMDEMKGQVCHIYSDYLCSVFVKMHFAVELNLLINLLIQMVTLPKFCIVFTICQYVCLLFFFLCRIVGGKMKNVVHTPIQQEAILLFLISILCLKYNTCSFSDAPLYKISNENVSSVACFYQINISINWYSWLKYRHHIRSKNIVSVELITRLWMFDDCYDSIGIF